MLRKAIIVLCISFLSTQGLWADDELDFDDLLAADFEDLMNISVVTPSRKEQVLFEVPVSTSVLTREDIIQSGATSLVEALRLFPGVVVREIINGQYDVHVRGLDNVPPNKGYPDNFNKSTLVMIDHRPVYNHLNGAMLWSELPIDIHDIERVELVRGPVGALYGANAATGVIHFITSHADTERNHVSWSRGEYDSEDIRARFASKVNETTAFSGSISHKYRGRTDERYYSFYDNEYVPLDELKVRESGQLIDPTPYHSSLSEQKTAINLFWDVKNGDSELTRFSVGYAASKLTSVLLTRSAPQGNYFSEHSYFGVYRQAERYQFKFSVRQGVLDQHAPVLFVNVDTDYDNLQTSFDYHIIQKDDLELTVGAAYERNIYFSDLFGGGEKKQENPASSVQLKYDLSERVHVTTSLRGDYFETPDKVFWSFAAGLDYQHSSELNGRMYVGRSHQSPFFGERFLAVESPITNGTAFFNGSENHDLVVIDSLELGVRYRLLEHHALDWEIFATQSSGFVDFEQTIQVVNGQVEFYSQYQEIPLEALQLGSTLSIQSRWTDALTSHFYATVQRTELDNAVDDARGIVDKESTATPSVYGGAVVNYQFADAWSMNVNGYYLGPQSFEYRDVDESLFPKSTYSEDQRWIVNTKLSYQVNEVARVYLNGRNLVNSRQPQLQYTDHLNSLWMAGIEIDF